MAKVELAPLRSWDDFFPGSERFGAPDVTNMTRWNNRVVSNLLYYQTNYLVLSIAVFLIVGFLNPVGMVTALVVVSIVFLGLVWAGENQAIIKSFKRQSPTVFVMVVMAASYMLTSLLGSVMTFMTAVTLPLILIMAHASFRLRNMKNKLQTKLECSGLKRTPMGILLECLEQQEENIQKIQTFLEGKVKE
ncbi:PREDICTED: PRA1 family protein 3-like [Cyprinodon variegatus]|uniref:PRA1 family protein n=1 Tax=Cyprinodon variegatus TaxID=28743 RepID=A0A3Q2G377_CYPVA|nr:PREDICTED: PRA1 family protein 3-like [Cyprinodon variegatus]